MTTEAVGKGGTPVALEKASREQLINYIKWKAISQKETSDALDEALQAQERLWSTLHELIPGTYHTPEELRSAFQQYNEMQGMMQQSLQEEVVRLTVLTSDQHLAEIQVRESSEAQERIRSLTTDLEAATAQSQRHASDLDALRAQAAHTVQQSETTSRELNARLEALQAEYQRVEQELSLTRSRVTAAEADVARLTKKGRDEVAASAARQQNLQEAHSKALRAQEDEHARVLNDAQAQIARLEAQARADHDRHRAEMESLNKRHSEELANEQVRLLAVSDASVGSARETMSQEITILRARQSEEVTALQQRHAEDIAKVREEMGAAATALRENHVKELGGLKERIKAQLATMKDQHAKKVADLEAERDGLQRTLDDERTEHARVLSEHEEKRKQLEVNISNMEATTNSALGETQASAAEFEQRIRQLNADHEKAMKTLVAQHDKSFKTCNAEHEEIMGKLFAELESERQQSTDKINELSARVEQLTKENESHLQRATAAQKEFEAMQAVLRNQDEVKKAETHIGAVIEAIQAEIASAKATSAAHHQEAERLYAELLTRRHEVAQLTAERDNLTAGMQNLQAHMTGLNDFIASLQQNIAARDQQVADLAAERDHLSTQAQQMQATAQHGDTAAAQLRDRVEELQRTCQSLASTLSGHQETERALQQQVADLEGQLRKATNDLESARKEVEEANERASEVESNLTSARFSFQQTLSRRDMDIAELKEQLVRAAEVPVVSMVPIDNTVQAPAASPPAVLAVTVETAAPPASPELSALREAYGQQHAAFGELRGKLAEAERVEAALRSEVVGLQQELEAKNAELLRLRNEASTALVTVGGGGDADRDHIQQLETQVSALTASLEATRQDAVRLVLAAGADAQALREEFDRVCAHLVSSAEGQGAFSATLEGVRRDMQASVEAVQARELELAQLGREVADRETRMLALVQDVQTLTTRHEATVAELNAARAQHSEEMAKAESKIALLETKTKASLQKATQYIEQQATKVKSLEASKKELEDALHSKDTQIADLNARLATAA